MFFHTKTHNALDLSKYNGKISEIFINELASCMFTDEKKNLVRVGYLGRGKTNIAIGISLKACTQGMIVLFKNATSLSTE